MSSFPILDFFNKCMLNALIVMQNAKIKTQMCYLLVLSWIRGGTVVQWSTVNSQQEGPRTKLCMEFARSPCICVGSLWLLWLPPTIQRHAPGVKLTGHSQLPMGVWLFVSRHQPCDELETCPGCTLPSLNISWDRLQHPPLPYSETKPEKINEWMNE